MKILLVLHWVCFAIVIFQSFCHVKTALEVQFPNNNGAELFLPPNNSTTPRASNGETTKFSNTTSRASDVNIIQKTKTNSNKGDIPIVIISSLRPDYLERVLEAIQPSHQSPDTPSWILHSQRYVFAHKNENTDMDNRWQETQEVAQRYGYELHVFEGLTTYGTHHPAQPIRAYYTKHTWYRMMRHLFYDFKQEEVLILEDDAVLAPDGLLMAATLLEHQHQHSDTIHGIALGGHAGQNKVNADPHQFMAVRPRFFQAMAYSMNIRVFKRLNRSFVATINALTETKKEQENAIELADWTMEITERNLIPQLTQLQPSVGRMHHIGRLGMGNDGNGGKRDDYPIPWALWNETVYNTTQKDLYLFPSEITDTDGFVCSPPQWYCPNMPQPFKPTRFEPPVGYGRNKVMQRTQKEREEYLRNRPDVYTPGKPHPLFPNSGGVKTTAKKQQQSTSSSFQTRPPKKKKKEQVVKFWDLSKGGAGTITTLVPTKPKRTKGVNVFD